MARDIEPSLRNYVPALFDLLGSNNLLVNEWGTINENFQKDFEKMKAALAVDNFLFKEVTFYQLIYGTGTGNVAASRMLNFINHLLSSLNKHLPDETKIKLRPTLYHILINFDHKYRNFVGELAALNTYLNSGFKLLDIEQGIIAGNRKADFTMYKDDINKVELIEVVNIHFNNQTDLKRFLLGKLNDKIARKIGGAATYNSFTLFPVLWAMNGDMVKLQEMFRNGNVIDIPLVHQPFAYCSFLNEQNELRHRFVEISNLFPDEIIQEIKAVGAKPELNN